EQQRYSRKKKREPVATAYPLRCAHGRATGSQNLIAAMLCPLATPGRLPLVNFMPALFWQLGDVAHNASSFIKSRRLGNFGVALIRITIDISDGLLGPVYNSVGRR